MKILRIQDTLIWARNELDGYYTAKKGYEVALMEQFDGEKPWWWHDLWYSNSPIKTILTLLAGNKQQIADIGKFEKKRTAGPRPLHFMQKR